jgi:hypothetical protein
MLKVKELFKLVALEALIRGVKELSSWENFMPY